MKKRIIIEIIITILVVIIINHKVIFKDLYTIYKLNQIRNDFINVLSGKFNERTSSHTIKYYESTKKSIEELNHNNITELIELYINTVINGLGMYINNGEKVVWDRNNGLKTLKSRLDFDFGEGIAMSYQKGIDYAVGDSFTSEDVTNYKNGTFKSVLINKLKKCLEYEEHENNIEWYINYIEDKRIELPYMCYIDYKANQREYNKEYKRTIDVILDKKFKLKKNDEKVIVKYETFDGEIKEKEVKIYYIDRDGKENYVLPLYKVLALSADREGSCELKSYIIEKWEYEWQLEIMRLYGN